MNLIEFTAKNLSDAITEACQKLGVTSDRLYYEVVEEGSIGFLGIGSKPAVIKAAVKEDVENEIASEQTIESSSVQENKSINNKENNKEDIKIRETKTENSNIDSNEIQNRAKTFLNDVFAAMGIEASVETKYNEENKSLNVNLNGEDMGILIGKRGQTLDSLQYLVSLVINKGSDDYIRVKVDTENYRQRRKETLENLARNIAYKVKRTKRPVSLEPMNA